MLSVRIRRDLHIRLKKVAQLRGVSLSTLVEDLIDENLFDDVTAQMKLQSLQTTTHTQKLHLETLETLILNAAEAHNETDAVRLLSEIRDLILECHEVRARTQQEIDARREAREQALSTSPPKQNPASPFDGLSIEDLARADHSQLQQPQRRYLRLLCALNRSPKGTRTRLANVLGVSASYFSQMLSGPHHPRGRPINDEKARKLEIALGIPPGALDAIEPQAAIVSIQKASLELESVLHKIKLSTAESRRDRTDH
ncbi:MAG TPA: hypothetical protein VG320_10655 [Paraburkholderia sp.]|jgi:transcriptional regulator with XRE-family HTH domain|uniref:hypothetical protein n=1 Tax=Paraburkholderia sp. TaxID=1926495 RepID=UPI002DE34C43|nr:hypothetical protein [Paraburkholderia sp.]